MAFHFYVIKRNLGVGGTHSQSKGGEGETVPALSFTPLPYTESWFWDLSFRRTDELEAVEGAFLLENWLMILKDRKTEFIF